LRWCINQNNMTQRPGLYIAHTENRGRGVFTAEAIPREDVFEIAHVIEIPPEELPIIHKSALHDYYFLWGENLDRCVIALGFGSLYNHKIDANATFILDLDKGTIDFIAVKDIKPGEEITINYHGENGDDTPLWWQNRD